MTPPSPAARGLRSWAALGVVGLGASIAPLDFAVNIIFPAMATDFGLQPADIRWAAICLVLTYGSLMLAFGALGDRVGHLQVFRAGLALAVVAFSICTWASAFDMLLAGRVLQGIAVALVISCAPALATRAFAESRRTEALSVYGSLNAAAGVAAPLIGALSLITIGWQGVFAIRIPIMALALAASYGLGSVLRPVERSSPRLDAIQPGFASIGWLALGLALTLLTLPLLGELGRPQTGLIALSIGVCLALGLEIIRRFAQAQRTSDRPYLPHSIARNKTFWSLQGAAVLVQFASFAVPLIAPFALLGDLSHGALASGALMGTWALGTLAGSAATPHLALRWGVARCTRASFWLAAVGLSMVALWPQIQGLPWMLASLALQGCALGVFQVTYGDQVIASLPLDSRGIAGSITMVTRTVGLVMGASVWIALLKIAGFDTVYVIAAVTLLLYGLLTLRLRHWSIAP